jgi:hypothetical protein
VGVDHPRDDGFAGDVDNARAGAAQRRYFLIAADKDNAITADGDRLRMRQRRIGGIDTTIGQNEIGLLRAGRRRENGDRAKRAPERMLQIVLLAGSWRINLGMAIRL